MLHIQFDNVFKVGKHGLTPEDLVLLQKNFSNHLTAVQTRGQGFYSVIDDANEVQKILKFATTVKGKYSSVVVLGIGGSALGTSCLAQSLKHLYDNELKKRATPKLYVLDNIDPIMMREVLDVIDVKKTLFVVITKSGSTPETLSQYFYFRKITDTLKIKPAKAFVFVTDPKEGLLRSIAHTDGIPVFGIPPNVGGRFSVLTAVGLLPAALIGINIKKLLQGARSMRNLFLNSDLNSNLPYQLATVQYGMYHKGKVMHVIMPYAQKLIRFADWFRQLLAESIGKAVNRKGETINVGITPINALGATDQHSQSQLYHEGPFDKFFIIVGVQNLSTKTVIPAMYAHEPTVAFLKGVSFNKLIATEQAATTQSLTDQSRPNITITLDSINEEAMGELFMLFEGATAFLGELFGVDAFNQPGVEFSKKLTKQYLSS